MTTDSYSNIIKKSLGENEKIKEVFSLSSFYLKIKMAIAFVQWALFLALIVVVLMMIQKNIPTFLNLNKDLDMSYKLSDNINLNTDNNNLINFDTSKNINFIELFIILYVFLVIPLILFYYLFYLKISNEYVFTTDRVIIKKGWIATKTVSAKYSRITDANVSQSLIERILKIGTISINTAGSEGYEIVLKHIAHPYELKKDLHNFKEKYVQDNFLNKFSLK